MYKTCDFCGVPAPEGGNNPLGFFCSDACSESFYLKQKFEDYKERSKEEKGEESGARLDRFLWLVAEIYQDWKDGKFGDREYAKLMDLLMSSPKIEL
jgi:hypothetical protein